MSATETEIERALTFEERRVIGRRAEELERAGYGPVTAMELALPADVDLHRAVALCSRGCPPDTAVRILV
jgi:hypothetical protein